MEIRRNSADIKLFRLTYIPTGGSTSQSVRGARLARKIVQVMDDDGNFCLEDEPGTSGRVCQIAFAEYGCWGNFLRSNIATFSPEEYVQLGRPILLSTENVYKKKRKRRGE